MNIRGNNTRLLLVINSLEGGGAERVFSNLANYLNERYQVMVLLLDDQEIKYKLADGMVVKILSDKSSVSKFIEMKKLVEEYKPGVVLSFLTRANLYSVLVGRLRSIPVIISERSDPAGRLTGKFSKLKKYITALSYKSATKIVSVSQGIKISLVEGFSARYNDIEVIYNGVDVAAVNQLADVEGPKLQLSEDYIIYVGRLVKTKCVDLLIDAYIKSGLDCKLLILGDGPEEVFLKRKIASYDRKDHIVFMNYCSNPFRYMKEARMMVTATSLEGFPNTLIEGLALGLPIIATDCSTGPREILSDSLSFSFNREGFELAEYGILTEVNNSDAMSSAMRNLYNNDKLLELYSNRAKERSACFDMESFFDKFVKCIEGVSK